MASSPSDISKTFCVMPWTNLATETNGKCKICCIVMTNKYIKREDGSDFEIQKDRIEDIWNSSYVREVRKKMLAGERVADCFYCHGQEDRGQKSPRESYNEMWFDSAVVARAEESKIKDGHVSGYPTSLEPRPGILCNLKCNMCWSLSSSKIFSERKDAVDGKIADVPDFLIREWQHEVNWAKQSDFSWSESERYLENLEKCIPTLKRLYFTGGEPTLIKSNLTALRRLIELGRTNLLVSFTTNLQILKPEWIEVMQHFSRAEVTGSVDGLGAANDYIRFPSDWTSVEANLRKLYSLHPKISLSIIYVVQAANVLSFVELIRWIAREFPDRQMLVMPTMLQGPSYLRPDILNDEVRVAANRAIDDALSDPKIIERNKQYLRDVRNQIQAVNPKARLLRAQFRDYIAFLDRTRGTDFAKTFPEMASLLKPETTDLAASL